MQFRSAPTAGQGQQAAPQSSGTFRSAPGAVRYQAPAQPAPAPTPQPTPFQNVLNALGKVSNATGSAVSKVPLVGNYLTYLGSGYGQAAKNFIQTGNPLTQADDSQASTADILRQFIKPSTMGSTVSGLAQGAANKVGQEASYAIHNPVQATKNVGNTLKDMFAGGLINTGQDIVQRAVAPQYAAINQEASDQRAQLNNALNARLSQTTDKDLRKKLIALSSKINSQPPGVNLNDILPTLTKTNKQLLGDTLSAGFNVGTALMGGGILKKGTEAGLTGLKELLGRSAGQVIKEAIPGAVEQSVVGAGQMGSQAASQNASNEDILKSAAEGAITYPIMGAGLELAGNVAGAVGSTVLDRMFPKLTDSQITSLNKMLAEAKTPEEKSSVLDQAAKMNEGSVKTAQNEKPFSVSGRPEGAKPVETSKTQVQETKPIENKLNPVNPVESPVKTESPEPTKIEPTGETVKVPRSQVPVGGSGETKVSRLAARVSEKLGAITPEERAKLPEYEAMTHKDQLQKAAAFVEQNPKDALAILRGDKPAPEGLLHGSIFLAAEQKAIDSGDATLIRDLASLRATRAGQELSILAARDPNSPVKYLDEVKQARYEIKGGEEKVKKQVKQTVKEGMDVIKKAAPKKAEWSAFLDEIRCK